MILVRSVTGRSLRQFVKYCLVGVLNTMITLAAIFILMKILGANYLVSNVLGYLLGFVNSFVMNKIWTFASKGRVGREATLFIIIFAVSYGAQFVFLLLLKEGLRVSPEMSQIIAMIFYTIVNFSGNKYFTFRTGS